MVSQLSSQSSISPRPPHRLSSLHPPGASPPRSTAEGVRNRSPIQLMKKACAFGTHEPIAAPRIPDSCARRGFFLVVAIFLTVTALLKLYSVMLETQVLGAADPLLPVLTVRQMTFTAALLELVVATELFRVVLLRPAQTASASWLVLWLVGVFAAYRVGLWAIDFRGHCSCLGHVLDYLPGSGAWIDWAMVGALAAMGLGGLCSIALPRRVGAGLSVKEGPSQTSLLPLVAVLWSPAGLAEPLPPLAVTAQYLSESFPPSSADAVSALELRINIYSSNRWWRIRTEPLDTGLVPVDWMRIPDGVRSHSVIAPDPTVTNWFPAAEAYAGQYPSRGDTGLLLAWLAYVPHPELPTLDDHRIRRFLAPEFATDARNEGTYSLEWLASEAAFLARLSITNNGLTFMPDGSVLRQEGNLASGWLEFEYRVSATTNLMGIRLPVLGTLTHFRAPPDGASVAGLRPGWVETIRLLDVRPLVAEELPRVEPEVIAVDYRLPGLARGRSLNYIVTNDLWKPITASELRSLAAVELQLNKRQPSLLRAAFSLLLVVLVLSPAALWLARRWRCSYIKNIKQQEHP